MKTRKKFIEILKLEKIDYILDGEKIVITDKNQGNVYLSNLKTIPSDVVFNNQGGVYLSSLKTIPSNVVFNNQGIVDLSNLKTIPSNVVFNNQGIVDLSNLKTIPSNVVFNNHGTVCLNSLKTMPSNVVFNNKGYVDLSNLKTMPSNVVFNNKGYVNLDSLTSLSSDNVFNNQGYVYLDSLTSLSSDNVFNNQGIVYLASLTSMPIDIKVFDIYGMKINNTKQTKGYTIYDCNYLGNKKHCFVAEKDGFTAHGETVKKAIEDVEYKIISEKLKNEPITLDTIVDVNHYRMITGACELGTTNWLKENNLKKKKYKVSEILPILEKTHAYGVERFKELIK